VPRALALLLLAGTAAGQTADSWFRVAALYHQRLQDAGIGGSSLMVVRNGAIVHKAFEGFQDLERRRPVDEETIYHWASITKTFRARRT